MRPEALVAEYLLAQAREEILRIMWLRGNKPIEFSHLRLALEAAGVKADHPGHWGSLSSLLSTPGKGQMTEVVGREQAAAATRNDARNNVHRLTPEVWIFAKMLAERRGWPAPPLPDKEPAHQTALV